MFSSYSNFCLEILVMQKNGFIKKIRLISNIYDLKPKKQIIAMQILLNIPRSMGNQAIKTGQLTEYNMNNIFHGKLFTAFGRETISRCFS